MIFKKIFVSSCTIMVQEPSEMVIQLLRNKCKRGFGAFTSHSFKFLMIGKVGIHRIHDSCYISGMIQDNGDGCTVHYSVYPGITFWICSVANILFLIGNFICVINLKNFISNFFFKLLAINIMLLLIETLETRRQERWCSEKIEEIVHGYSTYEVT